MGLETHREKESDNVVSNKTVSKAKMQVKDCKSKEETSIKRKQWKGKQRPWFGNCLRHQIFKDLLFFSKSHDSDAVFIMIWQPWTVNCHILIFHFEDRVYHQKLLLIHGEQEKRSD